MVDYSKKYQKIVNQLVRKSFPKLRGKNIKVIEIPKLVIYWINGFVFGRFIFLIDSVRKLNKEQLIGLIAHELCHVEESQKRNFLQESFNFIRENLSWAFNTSYSKKVERVADINTIKRGYAKESYKFTLRRETPLSKKELSRIYSRGYLSAEEIKSYAKKIEKW